MDSGVDRREGAIPYIPPSERTGPGDLPRSSDGLSPRCSNMAARPLTPDMVAATCSSLFSTVDVFVYSSVYNSCNWRRRMSIWSEGQKCNSIQFDLIRYHICCCHRRNVQALIFVTQRITLFAFMSSMAGSLQFRGLKNMYVCMYVCSGYSTIQLVLKGA